MVGLLGRGGGLNTTQVTWKRLGRGAYFSWGGWEKRFQIIVGGAAARLTGAVLVLSDSRGNAEGYFTDLEITANNKYNFKFRWLS